MRESLPAGLIPNDWNSQGSVRLQWWACNPVWVSQTILGDKNLSPLSSATLPGALAGSDNRSRAAGTLTWDGSLANSDFTHCAKTTGPRGGVSLLRLKVRLYSWLACENVSFWFKEHPSELIRTSGKINIIEIQIGIALVQLGSYLQQENWALGAQ